MSLFYVSDIRQYAYCPRIIYYQYCLPHIRPVTFKMQAGLLAQESEEEREKRRSLRTYHLEQGERFFKLPVVSEKLGLSGEVDLAIRCPDEAIPVEYKDSAERSGRHVALQLTAYGLLLEELWHLPARRGFIYFIPTRRAREITLDVTLRQEVQEIVSAMRTMIERESMPPAPARRAQCSLCEWRRFCNDVT